MAWVSGDREKIRQILGYPIVGYPSYKPSYLDIIQEAMDIVTAKSPESIAYAQSLFTKYDATRTELEGEISGSGLIAAGSLRWQIGAKNSGYHSHLTYLANELSTLLNLLPFKALQSSSSPSLLRS